MSNLEEVIADAVSDSQLPPEEPTEAISDASESTEVSSPADTPVEDAASAEPQEPAPESDAAASPAADAQPQDDFAKKIGIPAMGPSGRENRIPYSRVKKIAEKSANDAVAEVAEVVLGRKLQPSEKALDTIKSHVAAFPELQTKVADYEARLHDVGTFEDIMENEPRKFLQMLARIPTYQPFFAAVSKAFKAVKAGEQPVATETPASQPVVPAEDMPQPNQELSDGSKVYDMEGLQNLLAWHAKQIEARVTKQVQERYKPIESAYEVERKRQAEAEYRASLTPVIRAQIEEAKTWPQFAENEEEITKVLEADQSISLEGAYRKVVLPKLVADKDRIRQEVLQEARNAPRSTAVTGNKVTPKPAATGAARTLEEIIKGEVDKIR